MRPRLLDLFCGAGGANLIEQARAWNGTGSALDTAELLLDLADALEAAEAEVARLREATRP